MIVRDEAHVIKRCLDSVKAHISGWVIVDTGSNDGTQDVVKDTLAGIPGKLIEYCKDGEFFDFGHHRTVALDAVPKAEHDYILFIDADETFVPNAPHPFRGLKDEAYVIPFLTENVSFYRVALIKSTDDYHYQWSMHECLTRKDGAKIKAGILTTGHVTVRQDGCRSRDPDKYKKDLAHLMKVWFESGDDRYLFYMAQMQKACFRFEEAIDSYTKYMQICDKQSEEYWYSCYSIANILDHQGNQECVNRYLECISINPDRIEPYSRLCQWLRRQDQWHPALIFAERAVQCPVGAGTLWVENEWSQWKAMDELSTALGRTGNVRAAEEIASKLIKNPFVPYNERCRIRDNHGILVKELMRLG